MNPQVSTRTSLWSSLEGEGANTLILVHGLTGDAASVARYQPDTSGIARLFIELPHHGRSPAVGDFSRDDVIARVADTVRREVPRIGRVHLLGVSLGATVARGLALVPDLRIDSLILIRPTHAAHPLPEHLALNLLVAQLLADDPGSAADRLRENPEFARVQASSPSAAANLLTKAATTDPAVAAARGHLLRAGSAWTTPAGEVALPTLIVAAADDALHPHGVAQRWAQDLPGSWLAHVPAPRDPSHDAMVRSLVGEHLRGRDA